MADELKQTGLEAKQEDQVQAADAMSGDEVAPYAPGSRAEELAEMFGQKEPTYPELKPTIAELSDLEKADVENWLKATGLKSAEQINRAAAAAGFSPTSQEYAKRVAGVEEQIMPEEFEQVQKDAQMDLMRGIPEPAPVGTDSVLKSEDDRLNEAMDLFEQASELDKKQQEEREVNRALAQQKAAETKARVQAEQQAAAEKEVKKMDEEAKANDDGQIGGLDFGTAIAILLGGAKQGLIGGDNPALTMLDKIAEREEKKREELIAQNKLTQEQALAQEKWQYEKMMKTLQARKLGLESQSLLQGLQEKQQQIAMKQQLAASGKYGLTNEQLLSAVPEKEQPLYIRNPEDGMFYRTTGGTELAKTTKNNLSEIQSSLPALERLRQIADIIDERGAVMGTISKVVDRNLIGEADSLQQQAIGGLRVAIFGPGVITDNERRIAERVIRNPTKLFTITSANKRVLDTVIRKVRANMKIMLRNAGAEIPKSQNEINIEKLQKLNPKKFPNTQLGRANAANFLIDNGRWQDE